MHLFKLKEHSCSVVIRVATTNHKCKLNLQPLPTRNQKCKFNLQSLPTRNQKCKFNLQPCQQDSASNLIHSCLLLYTFS
jgi:hypothetical protein